MWTLAFIFAIVYALPELTILFAWSTLEAVGYSALFGVAMTIIVQRLDGAARAVALTGGGVIFAFPIPMMLALLPYSMDVSGIWLARAVWFLIATALLLIANGRLSRQQALDRESQN